MGHRWQAEASNPGFQPQLGLCPPLDFKLPAQAPLTRHYPCPSPSSLPFSDLVKSPDCRQILGSNLGSATFWLWELEQVR